MTKRRALSTAAISLGIAAGSLSGAGAANANTTGDLGLGVGLPTTTALVVGTPTQVGDSAPTVTETATVSLEGLGGALITPTGSVRFEAAAYIPNGDVPYPIQYANLSSCLLGLAPVAGLWQATCTATVTITLTNGVCDPTVFEAIYAGDSDLIAEPSESNRVLLPSQCST